MISRFLNAAKRTTVIVYDLLSTAAALVLALALRFQGDELSDRLGDLTFILPIFVIFAGFVYNRSGLYRSKWRFASLPDLFNITRAATILAAALLIAEYALRARGLIPDLIFGGRSAFMYWILQMFFLGGARLTYRYYRYVQSHRTSDRVAAANVLVVGRTTEAEVVLRAFEGMLRHRYIARGILSPQPSDLGLSIRGVSVAGGFRDLERLVSEYKDREQEITKLVFAPSNNAADPEQEALVSQAQKLGIGLARMQALDAETDGDSAFRPLEIEDLLFRPPVESNKDTITAFLTGKRVAVTGGGGSIGSELCARVAAYGAGELLIIDNSEPALYGVTEALQLHRTRTVINSAIADVRDAERIQALLQSFQPHLVLHAAALKHVPILERDWAEGVKTNVFGSINVADAAQSVGASFVMISTDKAVDPVSVLGATKRFAEIYTQMIDAEDAVAQGHLRHIAVRFGNVLGSVGSVVPKFKAQIERGGPVTVTHPEMVRYFMTAREACSLVLSAATHAGTPSSMTQRASIYVLKMGEPARIVDLARRMIRLTGREPDLDIKIVFTGTREGERLNEYLFAGQERTIDIGVDGVMAARTSAADQSRIQRWMATLKEAVKTSDRGAAERVFAEAIPGYADPQDTRVEDGNVVIDLPVKLAHPQKT